MASFTSCRSLVPREPGRRDLETALLHRIAPNSAPTPAVIAIASAPQKVIRPAPTSRPEPPTRAAMPPSAARKTSEVPDTQTIDAEQAASRRRSRREAIYESVASSIGTLSFVAFQLIGAILWVVINAGLVAPLRPFDPFPFPILSHIIGLEAVLVTAFVLMKRIWTPRCGHQGVACNAAEAVDVA